MQSNSIIVIIILNIEVGIGVVLIGDVAAFVVVGIIQHRLGRRTRCTVDKAMLCG
jgi:hypothetical protein